MDEQDEGLTRLTDLDVTGGVDLHAFLRRVHRRHLLPAMLAICTRARRSAHRKRPSPAMLATEQPRRGTRIKEARWTPTRSRKGGPKHVFVSWGRGGRPLGPGREGR